MDSSLIVQVIINIIDNAIKYTSKGFKIVIETKKEDKLVVVDIEDNGSGIKDEDKAKIFDIFFTRNLKNRRQQKKPGLGLSLCNSIITVYGGEISVFDHKPHGTVF